MMVMVMMAPKPPRKPLMGCVFVLCSHLLLLLASVSLMSHCLDVDAHSHAAAPAARDVRAYVISLSPDASADETAAADMIADELGNRTCGGAPLPIKSPSSIQHDQPTIAVGFGALTALQKTYHLPPLLPVSPRELDDDGFIAIGAGESSLPWMPWLALSGRNGSKRGTGYAAVHLLNACGIQFLAWDCTVYPPRCPSALPSLNWTQWPPQLSGRSVDSWPITHANVPQRFQTAAHFNPLKLSGTEGVSQYLPWSLSASHPEWFWPPPSKPGQGPPTFWNVCWSNSSLVEFVIAYVKNTLAASAEEVPFLEISPNDGPANCQTPLELQINAEEGTDGGSFFRAVNAIAEAISPAFPATKIVSLAYSWTQHPPQPLPTSKIPSLHPAVVPWFAPIDDNFLIPHLIIDPALSNVKQYCGSDQSCPWNRRTTADVTRWKELISEGNLWVWDYVTIFNGCDGYLLPFPNYYLLGENIRAFAQAGATNYYPEGNPSSIGGEMAELKTYIMTKMLWNPSLNVSALIDEFLKGYYGPAAPFMQEYIDAIVDSAAPSPLSPTTRGGQERRFKVGACVHLADRVWAKGGTATVTYAHPDGTFDLSVNHSNAEGTAPFHKGVSWTYLTPCENHDVEKTVVKKEQQLFVDMGAESCTVLQNGTHVGWGCGYITPGTTMRALRAHLAAAAAPGLTHAQAGRVARASLSTTYLALLKWEELKAWVAAEGEGINNGTLSVGESGVWPLPLDKQGTFTQFVALLKATGVTIVGEGMAWSEAWLHDRIFFGNATGCSYRG